METYKTFESRSLNDQEELVELTKRKAAELLDLMNQVKCEPQGEHMRYFALAKTALEESNMWFVKGVSRTN